MRESVGLALVETDFGNIVSTYQVVLATIYAMMVCGLDV